MTGFRGIYTYIQDEIITQDCSDNSKDTFRTEK